MLFNVSYFCFSFTLLFSMFCKALVLFCFFLFFTFTCVRIFYSHFIPNEILFLCNNLQEVQHDQVFVFRCLFVYI